MTGPMVSVVIPAYDAASTLARAVDSVVAQTFLDWELIVVDDGSRDETVSVARGYGDRLRLLRGPHLGPGEARNRGAAEARGRYLAWLDADDVWYPTKLEKQIDLAASDDALEFVTADYRYMDEAGRSLGTGFARNTWLTARWQGAGRPDRLVFTREDVPRYLREGFGATITMLLTRALFDRIGGFCGWLSVAEDVHLAIRAVAGAAKFGAVCEPLATYYVHPASTVRQDKEYAHRETIRAYQDLRRVLGTCEGSVQRALSEPLGRAHLDHATILAGQGRRHEGLAAAWRSLRIRPRRTALTRLLGMVVGG